jgi:hypothetical protein
VSGAVSSRVWPIETLGFDDQGVAAPVADGWPIQDKYERKRDARDKSAPISERELFDRLKNLRTDLGCAEEGTPRLTPAANSVEFLTTKI